MSTEIELKWEWPANRSTDNKLLVQINDIQKQASGFFGLFKSPSLINNFPDPRVISGSIINAEKSLIGKDIKLTLPLLELGEIKSGQFVMLGIINNSICICVVAVANKNVDLDTVECLQE